MKILAVLFAFALVASPAQAAVEVGQVAAGPGAECGVSFTIRQFSLDSGKTYILPSGVITSFTHAENVSGAPIKLKVLRSTGTANEFTVVGESAQVNTNEAPNATTTYPTRVPVLAGDEIALFGSPGVRCIFSTASALDAVRISPGDPALGSTATFGSAVTTSNRLNLKASVEPDADLDGFGDETQDQCPAVAARQTPSCTTDVTGKASADVTAPVASVSGKASQKVANGIEVAVQSNEPGSASASGTISVPGASKTVKLKSAAANLIAGQKTKLRLKLSKKNLKSVRRALRSGRRLKAKVAIVIKDVAGNASKATRTIKLKS